MMDVTIAIPAYNEGATIDRILRKIRKVLADNSIAAEILVVDDGSKDKTARKAESAGAKVISHPYNKGYGASLKTGALNASSDWVLYLDADGQHDPKHIPELLKHADKYDMVVAARKGIHTTSFFRTPGKRFLGWFASFLAEKKIPDVNSGFRLIKKTVIKKFISILPNTFSFTTTITIAALKQGYNVKYVPVAGVSRKGGKSTLSPIKDGIRFSVLILRTTMLFSPLRVFLPVSIPLMAVGFLYASYGAILFRDIPETSIILLLSGLMIFFFGLLADQISMLRRS